MTELFLVLLGAAWAAIFVPAALKAHRSEPLTSSQRFKRGMQAIAPPRGRVGRWVITPHSSGAADRLTRTSFQRAQERRASFLKFLLLICALSGTGALFLSGYWWHVHAGLDISLAIYVFLLLEAKHRRRDTLDKVRSIEARRGRVRRRVTAETWEALESRRA